MIISPPFLPVSNSLSSLGDALDPVMDAVDQFELAHGVYPIAFDRRWHTGIHLMPATKNERVRAIADGEVVAYRVCEKAIDGGSGTLDSNPGFVLLKHKTETGEGRFITFYSLYMHLLDLEGTKSLGINVKTLPRFLQTATPDEGQAGGGIKVNRKDVLGLPGECHGQRHIHFEIFMLPDDFKEYFGGTKLDDKRPSNSDSKDCWGHSYFIVPAGQEFLAIPPKADGHNKLNGIAFAPLRNGTNEDYSLCVESFFRRGNKYTNTWRINQDETRTLLTPKPVCESGCEYEMFDRASKLYRDCPSDGYELLRFGRILSDRQTLRDSAIHTSPGVDANVSGNPRPMDQDNPCSTWVRVTYAEGQEGYIDVNDSRVIKLSDADFPFFAGWARISEGSNLYSDDGMCDIDELKQLVGEVPLKSATTKEYEGEDALSSYVKGDRAIREKMRGFICEAPTEWNGENNEARYARLNDPDGFYGKQKDANPNGYSDFIELLAKFQFWEKTGLPAVKPWFFHPLKFIRYFRRCGWVSQEELAQIYPESIYSSVEKISSDYKEKYRPYINKISRKYGVNDEIRMSHFFGQCAIESYYMMVVRESAVRIADAIREGHVSIMPENDGYLRSPPARAADVSYFNRYNGNAGLGNTDAEDGVKFRGRGFKQLTGRYNYSQYWEFRGWSVGGPYNRAWFSHKVNGHYLPGPIIDHPELAGNDDFTCVDTAGFFWARYKVAKAADGGITEAASRAVTTIVNAYDHQSPPKRWEETKNAFQVLGE
ncbi:M23 family metallopeptidase [Burkholderia ubonensis]|uniref:M23 family metallopeptidase n=1 Tax=Burkholderia ubonensis TaxID=101571 RepID=UPI00117750D3|nr:M23 family metallopeptidase [Burkholderia ubonensis]